MTAVKDIPAEILFESGRLARAGSGIRRDAGLVAMARGLGSALLLFAVCAGAASGQGSARAGVQDATLQSSAVKPESKSGSLSGRLTDLNSAPLEGATVIARNVATGAEARTTTQKNGSYRFIALAAGEYVLVAESARLGRGSLDGILVPAGAEARLQTAMSFALPPPQSASGDAVVAVSAPTPQIPPAEPSLPASVAEAAQQPLAMANQAAPPSEPQTRAAALLPGGAKPSAVATVPQGDAAKNPQAEAPARERTPADAQAAAPDIAERLEALMERRVPMPAPESSAIGYLIRAQPLDALPVRPRALAGPSEPAASALHPPAQAGSAPLASASAISAIHAEAAVPAPAMVAAAANPLNNADFALAALAEAIGAAQSAVAEARFGAVAIEKEQIEPATPVLAARLTAEQIEALPLSGRNWQNFVLDTPTASSPTAGASPSAHAASGAESTETTIDGVSTRLAFGAASGSGERREGETGEASAPGMAVPWASGHGLPVAQAAIREVESAAGSTEAEAAHAAGGQIDVATEHGSPGLHGQGFAFGRGNFLGARNPFTQWITETSPAGFAGLLPTVPVFDNGPDGEPEPYTPPDREIVWGAGAGNEWKRRRLFWFGALDSYRRNDPGVATVKHPYLVEAVSGCTLGPCTETTGFFAQPTNDEMQVLSARLGLPAANPVAEGIAAYSSMLETLDGLLGPAQRSASQWVGFGRADWQAAERHRLTFEAIGAHWSSPGGGLTRVSETFGNHSFGNSVAGEELFMGRWEAFLASNLLAVTQVSDEHNVLAVHAETPSPFEQTLLAPSTWGQLPQVVVDSRYGLTIGNPARFGRGDYPNETIDTLKQSLDWVHGSLLIKGGFEIAHNADATTLLRNQTGTYRYSTVENFISDALVFEQFGLAGELNPASQHNCDQTGRVWVDSNGQVHGLGYLPCYSSYSQTIGPSGWQVSTNDWAGFATAQWNPAKRMVVSLGLRWEREQLPGPIALLDNPELPLTQKTPSLGNNWGPRISMAVGSADSRWPVLRLGYGMYFAATSSQSIETALTQTGSFKGDLNFFMRPTDNLHGGGAPPFPYVLSGAPGSVVKPGAVEFAQGFHNPEVHQAVASVEERAPGNIQISASAVLSLGRRLPVTIDANLDPAVNPGSITYAVVDAAGTGPIKHAQITVPFYASWPSSSSATGFAGRLNPDYQQVSQISSRANSTYEAAVFKLERYGRKGLSFHAHYTYAHATDWNPNESSRIGGSSVFDPDDFRQEYGTSDLDQRHTVTAMAIYDPPWKLEGAAGRFANGWAISAIGDYRSGLPYTMRTEGSLAEEFDTLTGAAIVGLGPGMNGSGGDNRVYGVGRNTYRYAPSWKADLRIGKKIDLGHLRQLELLAESFNLFNHENVTEIETTGYVIEPGTVSGALPTLTFLGGVKKNSTAFGQPLNIDGTDFYRERQFEIGLRMRF